MLIRLFKGTLVPFICVFVTAAMSTACSNNTAGNIPAVKNPGNSAAPANSAPAPASSTPASAESSPKGKFTTADLAKLKWLEGTWKGTGGDKPFFERYRFENDSTLVVETFADDSLAKIVDTSRFELKNGEFGHDMGVRRAVASSITENAVQFVPAPSHTRPLANGSTPLPQPGNDQNQNSFRFERSGDGTWNAILQWPARNGKLESSKVYKMEPWPKK